MRLPPPTDKLLPRILRLSSCLLLSWLLAGCVKKPEGIEPIKNFDKQHYLGKWYEIARLDHSFEKNMDYVTAHYSLRNDGGIHVVNEGFHSKKQTWKKAKAKAYFVDKPSVGHLKVSFFGPFYSSYIIFALDDAYEYAFITGNDRSYLWLLSRKPEISEELKKHFTQKARDLGFDTTKLIFPKQKNRPT